MSRARRLAALGRTASERPVLWLVVASVFAANALLSLARGDWWLGVLQVATSLLAGLSALAVAARPDGTDGTDGIDGRR